MILQCPECNTRYLVPDTSIGTQGRTVRCAKCKHTWQAKGVTTSEKELGELSGLVEKINQKLRPIPRGSNVPARRQQKPPITLMAGTLVAASIAITILLIMLYPSMIGSPPSKDFMLTDMAMQEIKIENADPIYEISGNIVNQSGEEQTVPVLRVTLVDKEGSALQYWDFSEDGKTLPAGDALPFTTGEIDVMFSLAHRFVVELGSPLELSLRKKP